MRFGFNVQIHVQGQMEFVNARLFLKYARWIRVSLFLLFYPLGGLAETYYQVPTEPICENGYTPKNVEIREIPNKFLPNGPRDQGTTPTCGPHAAFDAYGIFLNSQMAKCPWLGGENLT